MPDRDAAIVAERPEYASQAELDEAADAFVKAMGWRNQENLSKNLNLVVRVSDALNALDRALVRNFNIYRQEQIRRENEDRRCTCGPRADAREEQEVMNRRAER